MDQTVKQSIVDRLQQANNVLVTVKSNPDVDQLAACIGFTLFLNKLGKHATAVYSGNTPSTLEFLRPEETLEKNTDSLRDFIIALDKSKADKLRYKVEDEVVRIFITPYKTSISDKDLDFSQGDFNVDVVVALGVQNKQDLDRAITAHGRILHDATVISINNGPASDVGVLNLQDSDASSLCELMVDMSETLQADAFDAQMATAYLTGIVAETKRFSNDKTSPRTMTLSAKLMAAGANQQLIATKLQASMAEANEVSGSIKEKADDEPEATTDDDGTLHIKHKEPEPLTEEQKRARDKETIQRLEEELGVHQELPDVAEEDDNTEDEQPEVNQANQSAINDVKAGVDINSSDKPNQDSSAAASGGANNTGSSRFAMEPPAMGGTLTANSRPEDLGPNVDPLSSAGQDGPTLQHGQSNLNGQGKNRAQLDSTTDSGLGSGLGQSWQAATTTNGEDNSDQSTSTPTSTPDLNSARDAVERAKSEGTSDRYDPLKSVGSQPLDMNVQGQTSQQQPPSQDDIVQPPTQNDQSTPQTMNPSYPPQQQQPASPVNSSLDQPAPPAPIPPPNNQYQQPAPVNSLIPPDAGLPPEQTGNNANGNQFAPPPGPPPMMPPTNS